MGGSEGAGGVNRPDREWRRGEDLGETVQAGGWVGGDTVQPPEAGPGGEVPHAELELEQELVRRLWATGGVPMENWTLGGDMEMMSGAGEAAMVAPEGGAEIRRALEVGGNCLLGDLGELAGEDMEEHRGLRSRAGLGAGGQPRPEVGGTGPVSSSGSGPSMEPPEAELTPDIADTEFLSSAALEWISEFWIAAYAAFCVGT